MTSATTTQAAGGETNPAIGPIDQIDAGLLNVGYAEAGPADGPAVLGLHSWPYAARRSARDHRAGDHLEGDANGAPHADASSYAGKFSGRYSHRTIEGGVGHNLPQEAPEAFADAVIDVDSY